MGFKECYLIPKELYEKKQQNSSVPADVKLKQWDFHKRFQTKNHSLTASEESQLEQQMQAILNGIPDLMQRNLASQILTFIASKGGASIKWTDDFGVLLDNQRLFNLDIRDVLRHLVGVNPDFKRVSFPIYERLLELGIKPTLLMFYDNSVEETEKWDSEDEEFYDPKEDENWTQMNFTESKSDQSEGEHVWEKSHHMQLRGNRPKWKTYKI